MNSDLELRAKEIVYSHELMHNPSISPKEINKIIAPLETIDEEKKSADELDKNQAKDFKPILNLFDAAFSELQNKLQFVAHEQFHNLTEDVRNAITKNKKAKRVVPTAEPKEEFEIDKLEEE